MQKSLELSEISLVPTVVSEVPSRNDISTTSKLGNIELKIPIIAAPMKDVCNGEFGSKLIDLGCFGLIHRFCSIESQIQEYLKNKKLGLLGFAVL